MFAVGRPGEAGEGVKKILDKTGSGVYISDN
jgi:hypothetical protein